MVAVGADDLEFELLAGELAEGHARGAERHGQEMGRCGAAGKNPGTPGAPGAFMAGTGVSTRVLTERARPVVSPAGRAFFFEEGSAEPGGVAGLLAVVALVVGRAAILAGRLGS